MPYRIVLADSAKTDTENIHRWVTEQAPLRGSEWFEKLLDCLYSLAENPRRCPLAPEAQKAGRDIRNLLYGRRKHAYRILFEIDEGRQTVWILHIRHGGRTYLQPGELASPEMEYGEE